MNKFFKLSLFLFLFFIIQHFCDKKTKGFSLHKIASCSFVDIQLTSEPLKSEGEIESLLNQKFHFLGRGGQCFAFLGEDGETVIKFFKQHNLRYWSWLNAHTFPSSIDKLRQKLLKKHRHRSPLFFESCKIAFDEFKDRTGLIYLHLNETYSFKENVTIIDKLGIAHQIDPNTTRFALQKRAKPSYRKLKQLIKGKDFETAKLCIDSVLDLIVERTKKGIRDRDPSIRKNIGFIGNQAVEIDLGSFTKTEKTYPIKKELTKKTEKFKKWLNKRNGELANYLSERVEFISSKEP